MTLKTEHRELLRRLTLNDQKVLWRVVAGRRIGRSRLLDDRTNALVKLAGLIALNAEIASLQVARDEAWLAGADDVEIVGTMIAVVPIVGPRRIASVAPRLALALESDWPG